MGASSSRSRKLCRPAGDVIRRRSHRGGGRRWGCNSHVAASVHLVSMRPGSAELSSAAPAAPPAVRCAPRGRLERPGTGGVSGVTPPATHNHHHHHLKVAPSHLGATVLPALPLLPPPSSSVASYLDPLLQLLLLLLLCSFFSMTVMRTEQNNNQ